jgi:predicted unusual protein kinase regulating ubiquinone biosynthesis (AarF/ABC1/UbiB family)
MIRHRYRKIVLFFAQVIIRHVFWDLLIPNVGFREWSRRTRSKRLVNSASSFRSLAVQMGGVLIKVGQFFSSRVDVLPKEITDELAGLQDEVPPEAFADIRQVAETDFGISLEYRYITFEEEPLAAASLGQVHRAQIRSTSEDIDEIDVVVKIQRPNIENIIATDLAALRTVGKWVQKYKPIRRRADIPALLDEFSRVLYEEIDYLAEGRNAEMFAANFEGDDCVRVPLVFWDYTTKRVLTLENVWAIKITDYEVISAAGIDRAEVAVRLLDTYLKQIFEDGFFHADPHPGNLFVYPVINDASVLFGSCSWQLTFVDFGMVGRVAPSMKEGLRELLIGVGTQDAARVVKSYQKLGVLLPNADLKLIEQAGAQALERFWGKNMDELRNMDTKELHNFTVEYRELMYAMPFQIPQDIIFLARAVGILSGMCTGLDPEFNVWDHIAPYAKKLLVDEGKRSSDIWLEEAKQIVGALLLMPKKIDKTLARIERGEIAVKTPEVNRQVAQIEKALRQLGWGVIFAALLLGGVQLFIAEYSIFGAVLLVGSGLSLMWVILLGLKR